MKMISELQRPKLRNRDNLETQLAAEIAVGAITSLDCAIERHHEVALEYGAQLLFDNVRLTISKQPNLPQQIMCYLLFDRNLEIRHNILRKGFFKLPADYQEAFLNYLSTTLEVADDSEVNSMLSSYYSRESKSEAVMCRTTCRELLSEAADNFMDEFVVQLIKIKHVVNWQNCAPTNDMNRLRKLPKTVRVCYEIQTQKSDGRQIPEFTLALTHPDETIRIAAVKEVLKWNADKLRRVFPALDVRAKSNASSLRYGWRKGDIKNTVYLEIAEDPSPKVQMVLVNGIRHAFTLSQLAGKYDITNPAAARAAHTKGEKIQKRTEYTVAYQRRNPRKKKGGN